MKRRIPVIDRVETYKLLSEMKYNKALKGQEIAKQIYLTILFFQLLNENECKETGDFVISANTDNYLIHTLGLDPIVFHTNINLLEDLDIIKHTLSIQCFTKDENESQIQKYNWSLLRAPHREYYISSIGEPRERAKAFVKAKAEIPF